MPKRTEGALPVKARNPKSRSPKLQKKEAAEQEKAARGMLRHDADVVAGPDEGGWGQQRWQPLEGQYGYATSDQKVAAKTSSKRPRKRAA
jgi:hypothetical protein